MGLSVKASGGVVREMLLGDEIASFVVVVSGRSRLRLDALLVQSGFG